MWPIVVDSGLKAEFAARSLVQRGTIAEVETPDRVPSNISSDAVTMLSLGSRRRRGVFLQRRTRPGRGTVTRRCEESGQSEATMSSPRSRAITECVSEPTAM